MNQEILHDAVICKEGDTVLEASRIMRDTKTRHIIVVSEGTVPLGIISPFDINNRVVAEEKDASQVNACDIMTKPIETIDIDATYEQAAEKMGALETFTLPVVEDGKLIGILNYGVVYREMCEVKKDDKE